MKHLVILCISLTFVMNLQAQNTKYSFGTCFSEGNRKSIEKKMIKFETHLIKENNCPADSISWVVDQYYTVFYTQTCRHLPKQITVTARGNKSTYKHRGLSGAVLYWLLGKWEKVLI